MGWTWRTAFHSLVPYKRSGLSRAFHSSFSTNLFSSLVSIDQVYETGGAGMIKVTWFDNYWGWLERLVKKLRKWIEEEE